MNLALTHSKMSAARATGRVLDRAGIRYRINGRPQSRGFSAHELGPFDDVPHMVRIEIEESNRQEIERALGNLRLACHDEDIRQLERRDFTRLEAVIIDVLRQVKDSEIDPADAGWIMRQQVDHDRTVIECNFTRMTGEL